MVLSLLAGGYALAGHGQLSGWLEQALFRVTSR